MDLSILIVSWNTRDLLAQCLESVFSIQYSVFSEQRQLNTEHCLLNTEVAGLVGSLAAGMLGDWFLPFVYNIGIASFRASVLGWVFLGGLLALERWNVRTC